MEECGDVYRLTKDGQWDPHSDVYPRNEENMLYWKGNMVDKRYIVKILLYTVEAESKIVASFNISKI